MDFVELDQRFADITDAIAENIGVSVDNRFYDTTDDGINFWVCQFGEYGDIQMNEMTLSLTELTDVERLSNILVHKVVGGSED